MLIELRDGTRVNPHDVSLVRVVNNRVEVHVQGVRGPATQLRPPAVLTADELRDAVVTQINEACRRPAARKQLQPVGV